MTPSRVIQYAGSSSMVVGVYQSLGSVVMAFLPLMVDDSEPRYSLPSGHQHQYGILSSISSPTGLAGLRQGGIGPLAFVAVVASAVAGLAVGFAGAAAFGSDFVDVATFGSVLLASSGSTREIRFLSG